MYVKGDSYSKGSDDDSCLLPSPLPLPCYCHVFLQNRQSPDCELIGLSWVALPHMVLAGTAVFWVLSWAVVSRMAHSHVWCFSGDGWKSGSLSLSISSVYMVFLPELLPWWLRAKVEASRPSPGLVLELSVCHICFVLQATASHRPACFRCGRRLPQGMNTGGLGPWGHLWRSTTMVTIIWKFLGSVSQASAVEQCMRPYKYEKWISAPFCYSWSWWKAGTHLLFLRMC